MSEDERFEILGKLRYRMIDVLDSGRGRWVAAFVFLATWRAQAVWLLTETPGCRRNPALEVVWLGQFPAPPPIP